MDVVGAGVYGGIVKRDSSGNVVEGDEWPEDNKAMPAHNPVHCRGPYLDFSKLTAENRGYSHIATLIISGRVQQLEALRELAAQAFDIAGGIDVVAASSRHHGWPSRLLWTSSPSVSSLRTCSGPA